MKKNLILFASGAFVAFLPILVFAQGFRGILDLINGGQTIVGALIRVVSGIALLVFIWGLVKYIFAQGNEGSKADGKKIMLGGVIALFVLFSVWGIIAFIGGNLGLSNVPSMTPPKVNF